jgi:hypothetical protein
MTGSARLGQQHGSSERRYDVRLTIDFTDRRHRPVGPHTVCQLRCRASCSLRSPQRRPFRVRQNGDDGVAQRSTRRRSSSHDLKSRGAATNGTWPIGSHSEKGEVSAQPQGRRPRMPASVPREAQGRDSRARSQVQGTHRGRTDLPQFGRGDRVGWGTPTKLKRCHELSTSRRTMLAPATIGPQVGPLGGFFTRKFVFASAASRCASEF